LIVTPLFRQALNDVMAAGVVAARDGLLRVTVTP
jgi:hypothetical protein